MTRTCWFASLPGAGPCSGRLVRCHLIAKQTLKREGASTWNPATWRWGCGGPTGVGGHHGKLDYSRTLRIPRDRIPADTEQFAADNNLGWWLDRTYGPIGGLAV